MKKLDYNHLTTGTLTVDASHLIGVVNDLIDLVNSQQEAIEKLQDHVDHEARHVSEPADNLADRIEKLEKVITRETVRIATDDIIDALSGSEEPIEMVSKARYAEKLGIHDTHRTVTLRIPKGMGLGEALIQAYEWELEDSGLDKDKALDFRAWCFLALDTDLQKALDEVQPNE